MSTNMCKIFTHLNTGFYVIIFYKQYNTYRSNQNKLKDLKLVNYTNLTYDLILEFDGYMRSLNFSFVVQSRDEISKTRNDINELKICF
jgi:hypothetical protein